MTVNPEHADELQQRVLSAMLAMQRRSWEQGVASHALLDLGLYDLAEVIARDAVTHQTRDGRLAEMDTVGIVNSGAVGEVVSWAANRSGDPELRDGRDRQLEWILRGAPRANDGTLFHIDGSREIWADTVYMVVPLLALAGETDAAAAQFSGHRSRLFDESSGLYGWRWDEESAVATHPEHWGTASGWVVAAVARTIGILGTGHPATRKLGEHARTVIDACLALRAADGLFHNIVDDERTFSEGNLAQMLAYGIHTGVADGWLPASYESTGRSLVTAARRLVDRFGFVQGVCGAPMFDRSGTSVEAQAFFLLATAAENRLDALRPDHP